MAKSKSVLDCIVATMKVEESKFVTDLPHLTGSVGNALEQAGIKPGETVVILRAKDFEAIKNLAWRYESVSK